MNSATIWFILVTGICHTIMLYNGIGAIEYAKTGYEVEVKENSKTELLLPSLFKDYFSE